MLEQGVELSYHLEDLVDQHGLESILESLADICYAKSEHVASNWQDRVLAAKWDSNGRKINSLAARVVPTY